MASKIASNLSDDVIELPILPLRDVVVYPHMVIPLFVGREKSVSALDAAMESGKQILLVAQRSPDVDEPGPGDLYPIGTVATVLQLLKLPDGTIKVLVEGTSRAEISGFSERNSLLTGRVRALESVYTRNEREIEVISRSLVSLFEQLVKLSRKIPPELLATLAGLEDPSRLADTIAAHLSVRLQDKQQILETPDVADRLERLIALVDGEIDVQQIEKRIRGRVKNQMEKSQREYYLNEQMKAIQKELGDSEDAERTGRTRAQDRGSGHAQGNPGQGARGAGKTEADVADVRRSDRGAQLRRLAGWCPMEEADQGAQGSPLGPAGAGCRSFWPGQGQGSDSRVPCRAATGAHHEGADPVPGGSSRRGQDIPWPVDCQGHQPQVCSHVVCALDEIDIIVTDDRIDPGQVRELENAGVRVIIA